jgi:hypothetical protein
MPKNNLRDFNYITIFIFKFFYSGKYNYYIAIMTDKDLKNFLK